MTPPETNPRKSAFTSASIRFHYMFTGIIKKLSIVDKVTRRGGSFFVIIKMPVGWKVRAGESISINGICSTVRSFTRSSFEVEYMPETIKKTTVGTFTRGAAVNLEKSLKLSDLLDGHLVQGHVDATGKLIEIRKLGNSKLMKIGVPRKFMKFIAEKGSIAVDGISLTVVDTGRDWFTVSLVSFTLDNTNLGDIKEGDKLNIETDVIAKYVAKLLKH